MSFLFNFLFEKQTSKKVPKTSPIETSDKKTNKKPIKNNLGYDENDKKAIEKIVPPNQLLPEIPVTAPAPIEGTDEAEMPIEQQYIDPNMPLDTSKDVSSKEIQATAPPETPSVDPALQAQVPPIDSTAPQYDQSYAYNPAYDQGLMGQPALAPPAPVPPIDPMMQQPPAQMPVDPLGGYYNDPQSQAMTPPYQPPQDPYSMAGGIQATDPNMGAMAPPMDPNMGMGMDPNMGMSATAPMDPYGMAGMPQPNSTPGNVTPEKNVQIENMENIYDDLIQIRKILSMQSDPKYLKVKEKVDEALDFFKIVLQNLDSYEENIQEMIIKYKNFILILTLELTKLIKQDNDGTTKKRPKPKSKKPIKK